MNEALREAKWRGAGKDALNDPTCTRPHVVSALVFAAELARTLGATLTDRYQAGPDMSRHRRQFATKTGATIDINIPAAEVQIAGDGYRCDVAMTSDHVAIGYNGDYGTEGILALYLLDYMHEQGELPTRSATISGAQLALLSELRDTLNDEDPEPEARAE